MLLFLVKWINYLHAHSNSCHGVHLTFDPGSNLVGFVGKLTSKSLIILLLAQFILKSLITLGYQSLDLVPFWLDVLQKSLNISWNFVYFQFDDFFLRKIHKAHNSILIFSHNKLIFLFQKSIRIVYLLVIKMRSRFASVSRKDKFCYICLLAEKSCQRAKNNLKFQLHVVVLLQLLWLSPWGQLEQLCLLRFFLTLCHLKNNANVA